MTTEKKYKRWRAEKRGIYYTVGAFGMSVLLTEFDTVDDTLHWETGSYFRTRGEAQNHISYLKAKQRLKDSAEGFIPKQGERAYYVIYKDEMLLVSWVDDRIIPGTIHFKTFDSAARSAEDYKEDWELVINYETREVDNEE